MPLFNHSFLFLQHAENFVAVCFDADEIIYARLAVGLFQILWSCACEEEGAVAEDFFQSRSQSRYIFRIGRIRGADDSDIIWRAFVISTSFQCFYALIPAGARLVFVIL